MRLLALCLALLIPGLAAAQSCEGRDMRDHLTAEQRAEFEARMDGLPYPEGNHWVATRGDDRLHLIGTIHVHDPRLAPIATRLAPIVESADRMLVEAAPGDEARLQAYLARNPHVVRIPAPSLIDRLDDETWAALARAASDRGIPAVMAAQLQPWYLSLALAVPPCIMASMQAGQRGLDHMLMDLAAAAGTKIEALEPYTTLVDLLAGDPIDEQVDALRLGVLPTPQATDAVVTLKAQYFEERHGATLPLTAVTVKAWLDMDPVVFDAEFGEQASVLLDTRNRNWMPALLNARGTTIVAVGAGHFAGAAGLLNLLAAEGFTLTRAPF